MLRISRVHYPVTALGPGRRLGIWVQGCPLACRGCIARDTWDPGGGREVPVSELAAMWQTAVAAGADGLTISGGEPLEQPGGLSALLAAADGIRAAAGREADFLVYTGYADAEITGAAAAALSRADAVITGRYDVTQPTRLIWRGSANQCLTARTPLGERRYERYLDCAPDRAPMQVAVDGGNVWFVGVPRRGDLPRLERVLHRRGVSYTGVTWRP
jgi:anaerobic ribonucleoside-triphosphate reductase activating protein